MIWRIASLTLPLLLAACATANGAPARLQAGNWRFVLIDGQKPVSGATRLTIGADRVGANLGCNGLGGKLTIVDDRLVVGPLISTQMWCDGVMDQERAVQQLLSASPRYRIKGGRLVLSGGEHAAELEAIEPD